MSNVYMLEGSGSTEDVRYFYALRRDNEGNLYYSRVDLKDSQDSVVLFPNVAPEDLETFTVPGKDYFDNRDPATHDLTYSTQDVKYEQWRYDSRLNTYYIDDNGYFTLAANTDKPINPDNPNSDSQMYGIIHNDEFTYTSYGVVSNLNLREVLIANGWNGTSKAVFINEGILTSDNGNPTLTIDGKWPNTVQIINNNKILGANGFTTVTGQQVEPTDAIYVNTTGTTVVGIENNGLLWGGYAMWTPGSDAYAIRGIANCSLANTGELGNVI